MEQHDFQRDLYEWFHQGKIFRHGTDDATHSHQFHQIEGLVIDKHITMGDLKGTLKS